MPRAPSAAVRSGSSSNATSSADWCRRAPTTVSVRRDDAEPGGGSARSVLPDANLRSGSSVRTSTVTSPRRPCGLPIRPTTTSTWLSEGPSAASVDIHEVDPRAAGAGQGRDDGAERGGGAPAAADHLAEVVGVHADLQDRAAAELLVAHDDIVGVVDHPADQVLQRVGQHDQLSASAGSVSGFCAASASSAAAAAPSGVSSAGTGAASSAAGVSPAGTSASAAGASVAGASAAGVSSAGASAAFLAGAFLAAAFLVTASPESVPCASASALLNTSSLSALGSAVLSVPSVPL